MEKLTIQQMNKMAHAFGVDLYKAVMSHNKNDKKLPKEFYRNRYITKYDPTFIELMEKGYAGKNNLQDLNYYFVTDEGEKQFRTQFVELVNYKIKEERDLEYLKHRINFYCSYCGYNFCNDNSEHVIEYYLKYFINKEYVSHTTKDAINAFKKELNSYYKRGLIKL